jgi:IS5 family transposase
LIVEREISRVARLGARVARFFGKAKVRVQVALVAAVANLARLAALQAARAAPTP